MLTFYNNTIFTQRQISTALAEMADLSLFVETVKNSNEKKCKPLFTSRKKYDPFELIVMADGSTLY